MKSNKNISQYSNVS